jgi:hypothetical protein
LHQPVRKFGRKTGPAHDSHQAAIEIEEGAAGIAADGAAIRQHVIIRDAQHTRQADDGAPVGAVAHRVTHRQHFVTELDGCFFVERRMRVGPWLDETEQGEVKALIGAEDFRLAPTPIVQDDRDPLPWLALLGTRHIHPVGDVPLRNDQAVRGDDDPGAEQLEMLRGASAGRPRALNGHHGRQHFLGRSLDALL